LSGAAAHRGGEGERPRLAASAFAGARTVVRQLNEIAVADTAGWSVKATLSKHFR
jgi:hypothetical protein